MSVVLDCLIVATGWIHVLLAPYTKVEESFNLHATHDVFMYGMSSDALNKYDNFTFPGAVPRTFIGSIILAWLSRPAVKFAASEGLVSQKFDLQVIIRLVLASLNALGLSLIRRAVWRRFGRLASMLFTLLTITQFHLPFWMGRTLPNMFALLPVNIATYLLIDRAPNKIKPSYRSMAVIIILLTFTAVIFRAEVALLLAAVAFQARLHEFITTRQVIKVVFISGLLALALTVSVDSYLWNQPWLWPEFSGIYFNVIQGKSSEWGTSPIWTYWTSYLPKLLLSSSLLSFVGFLGDQRIRDLLFPYIIFIGLLSCLGHKEWRFIIYVVPAFNVAAVRGARWMVSLPKSTIRGQIMFFYVLLLLGLNIMLTYFLTLSSINNYPGGEALALLHRINPAYPQAHVHISNLAAQTGASLFLHQNAPPYSPISPLSSVQKLYEKSPWTYNKTESISFEDLTANKAITHLIIEHEPNQSINRHWDVVASVDGFKQWNINRDILKLPVDQITRQRVLDTARMTKEKKLWILERKR